MKATLPDHLPGILNLVPVEDQPKGEEEAEFWRAVAYEIAQLLSYASSVENGQAFFNDMRQAGTQYIWEFGVNDMSRPKGNSFNFHGQNTSQWLYAGCVLLCGGRVSTHH